MKNRVLMAAALLCAFLMPRARGQQQMGPIAVKGNITATGDVYAGGSASTNKACTQSNGLCGGAPATVTGVRFGNGGSPDTAATASQIATALSGATLTNNTSGNAANLSGTPALPNGVSATTQTTSDNTTKLATNAFVQAVKATIPTTTTINTVSCTIGSSCTIPATCAGTSCPNGTQVAVPFTTSSLIFVTADATSSATAFTVASTTGYPAVGCGQVDSGLGNVESFCWSSTDATHFNGLTRGIYGTTAIALTAVNGPFIFGYPNTLSTTISSTPSWVQLNNGTINYKAAQIYTTLNGGTVTSSVTNSISLTVTQNGTASSSTNVNSGGSDIRASVWNGSSAINDTWRWTNVAGTGSNPAMTLTLSRPSGSSGAATVAIPYQTTGPASAPSGTCAVAGAWVFSQDGHATFCPSVGGTWATKI